MSKMSFKEAYERLKEIYEYLSNNDLVDIDELMDLQKEARKLYEFCKEQIRKIEADINDSIEN